MDKLNFYSAQKVGKKWLITLDSGDWVALSEKNYSLLKSGKYKDDVFLLNVLKDRHIVLDSKNEADYVRSLRKKNMHLFYGPSLHIVAVTKRCNNDCLYCHANATGRNDSSLDMDEKTARKTVDFIFKSPNKNISIEFQGGEPLLNFDTVKFIVDYAKKKNKTAQKNLLFSLVTNMTIMDDDKLKFLMKRRVGLCTSLDGPKSVHDKNRTFLDDRGTYDTVVKWIKKIKKNYPLEALMVTTKHSLEHPKEIIDEYRTLGFTNIQLRPMLMLGKALANKDIMYSADEYLKFWKAAMEYLLKINKKQFLRDRFATYIVKKFFSNSAEFVDLNSPCGAAISTLAYDHDGKIFSCDEGRQYDLFNLGTVDMDYEKLFMGNECQSLIASTVNDCLLCDACVWKPFCGICVVCNYAKTGNVIPILSQDDRCKILKGQFEFLMEKILADKDNETFLKWIKA